VALRSVWFDHGALPPVDVVDDATVKPRSLVGKTMGRMAAEEVADLVTVDAKLKAITRELRTRSPRGARTGWSCSVSVPPAPPGSSPTSGT
jgi:hypothetical protein